MRDYQLHCQYGKDYCEVQPGWYATFEEAMEAAKQLMLQISAITSIEVKRSES